MATMAMAAATKRAMAMATMWQATKRVMARAARAITMATKRTIAMALKKAKATDRKCNSHGGKSNGNGDEEGNG